MNPVIRQVWTVCSLALLAFALLLGPALLAQAAGGVPTSTAAATADEWGNSFLFAFFTSWALKLIRANPKLAWFTAEMETKVQRWVSVGAAFLAGLGVSYTFDQTSGTLTIVGLTTTALFHAVRQFGLQEFAYQSAVKRI